MQTQLLIHDNHRKKHCIAGYGGRTRTYQSQKRNVKQIETKQNKRNEQTTQNIDLNGCQIEIFQPDLCAVVLVEVVVDVAVIIPRFDASVHVT